VSAQDSGSGRNASDARVARALVIEDDVRLRRTLQNALQRWAIDVRCAGTSVEARRELSEFQPELVVVDFMLPDGTAAELLAAAQHQAPLPAVVALSAYAQPRDAFELARLGVRSYLQKPIDLDTFDRAVQQALTEAPDIALSARGAVGHVGLKEAEETLRRSMVKEALDRSRGNRRGAARLLSISRELLQHVLRKLRD
jgi:two-component system response regulator RegA